MLNDAAGFSFLGTVTLAPTPENDRTRLSWIQTFESPEAAEGLRSLLSGANEQNLDRLTNSLVVIL